jgi:hypothetical protein
MLKTLMMTETHRRIKGTTHHAHFQVTSADISGVKVDADVPAALVSVAGHPGANAAGTSASTSGDQRRHHGTTFISFLACLDQIQTPLCPPFLRSKPSFLSAKWLQ